MPSKKRKYNARFPAVSVLALIFLNVAEHRNKPLKSESENKKKLINYCLSSRDESRE
jgi:hypothetical protein